MVSPMNIYDIWTCFCHKIFNTDLFFQFFKSQQYQDAPGPALHCTSDETLKDLLVFRQQNMPKPMFFQQLVILVNEFDYKKPIKCIYNQKEVTLLLNEDATVADLVNLEFHTIIFFNLL